jgi:hypothetical protein
MSYEEEDTCHIPCSPRRCRPCPLSRFPGAPRPAPDTSAVWTRRIDRRRHSHEVAAGRGGAPRLWVICPSPRARPRIRQKRPIIRRKRPTGNLTISTGERAMRTLPQLFVGLFCLICRSLLSNCRRPRGPSAICRASRNPMPAHNSSHPPPSGVDPATYIQTKETCK